MMAAHDTPREWVLEASAEELRRDLLDARNRTLQLIQDLDDEQLMGPRLPITNPLRWEIGHVAWFQEHWVERHLLGNSPRRDDADRLYDSMKVAHDTRWDLPLPSRKDTLDYMESVLEAVLGRIRSDPVDPRLAYFCRLVTFHEDMHDEAFVYTRQTLGFPPPALGDPPDDRRSAAGPEPSGTVDVPGGVFPLGAVPGTVPFVFDNEKWEHPVIVEPFSMSRGPVTTGAFRRFVEDNGYRRRDLWTPEGWTWRREAQAEHPVYWKRTGDEWMVREFDRWRPLRDDLPLIHVNWYEADAYCRWAGHRLPTEAEWEAAACLGRNWTREKFSFPWGNRPPAASQANLDAERLGVVPVGAFAQEEEQAPFSQLIGNVWEWTSSPFTPYPGFRPDPYADYSKPWMDGRHMVLRGGAWTTRSRLIRNTWRNFYTPDRRDVLAGFRTCLR